MAKRHRRLRGIGAALAAWAAIAGACVDDHLRAVLEQPVPPMQVTGRPLQAVVHDVLERSPEGGIVRLCRALADVPVTLETAVPTSLDDVLRSLARQAGSDLTITSGYGEPERLPTFPCPTGAGDYLVVGRPPV